MINNAKYLSKNNNMLCCTFIKQFSPVINYGRAEPIV